MLAKTGRAAEARGVLSMLQTISTDQYVPPYAIALVHAGLGERDAALTWLERAYEAHDVHLVALPTDAKWDPFRSEPRFIDVVKRCGFSLVDAPRPALTSEAHPDADAERARGAHLAEEA